MIITSGQAACRQCGSSAVSVSDHVTCSCIGARRLFSPLTGGCLCEGGYTFFNQAGQDEPQADSTIDCQPIVSCILCLCVCIIIICTQLTTVVV